MTAEITYKLIEARVSRSRRNRVLKSNPSSSCITPHQKYILRVRTLIANKLSLSVLHYRRYYLTKHIIKNEKKYKTFGENFLLHFEQKNHKNKNN